MARVAGQQVLPRGPDTPALVAPRDNSAEMIGAAANRVAGAVDDLGETINNREVMRQNLINAADADGAYVNYAKQANDLRNKFDSGPDGQGANAERTVGDYIGKLEEARVATRASLPTDAARKMFDSSSRQLFTYNSSAMAQRAAQQTRQYIVATGEVKLKTLAEQIPDALNDPIGLKVLQDEIQFQAKKNAVFQGADDALADWNAKQLWSAALVDGIDTKASESAPEAQALFEQYRDQLTEDDERKLASKIKNAMQPWIVQSVSDEVLLGVEGHPSGAPISPATVDKIDTAPEKYFGNILGSAVKVTSAKRDAKRNAEVGGSKNSSHLEGKAWDLTVPKGMTAEEAAKKIAASGTPFDQIIYYKNRVHVGLGDKMRGQVLKEDGGKFVVVDRAKATRDGGRPFGTPEELEASVPEMIARGNKIIEDRYGDNPVLKNQLEAAILSKANRYRGALNMERQANYQGIAGVMSDPENLPTNLSELYASNPNAKSWYAGLSETQQIAVANTLKSNSNPTLKDMRPDQIDAWNQLNGMAAARPAVFGSLNPVTDPLITSLPPTLRQKVLQKQIEINKKEPGYTSQQKVLTQAYPYLQDAGFKKTDSGRIDVTDPDFERFSGALFERLDAFYAIHKKEPDVPQVRAMVQDLMLETKGKAKWEQPNAGELVTGVPNEVTQRWMIYAQKNNRKSASGNIGYTSDEVRELWQLEQAKKAKTNGK